MISGNPYSSLLPLQKSRMPVPGGVCSIDLVPVEWVLYFPEIDPRYNTVTRRIRLHEGRSWIRVVAPDRDRSLQEEPKNSDAGPYFESTVSAYIPLLTAQNDVLLKMMQYYRYLIVVTLPNGIKKLVGTRNNPARFTRSFSTGREAAEDMGSPVQFSWLSEDGSFVYLGIPSESEAVAAPPQVLLGSGTGEALGTGTGGAVGTNTYP